MTSATPNSTTTLQGLSRAEAMSLRPVRFKRVDDALEIQVGNGQALRMEGFYKPEVKVLSDQVKSKLKAAPGQDSTVRGKQLRKAQEVLEKAQGLLNGQELQDAAALNEAGTLRNYWQIWQQWQGEALAVPEGHALMDASQSATTPITPAPSAGRDGAMSVLPASKAPVSALEASALGLGYVAAPAVGLLALAAGGGSGGGALSGLSITSPATVQAKENQTAVAKVTASNSGATFSLDSTSADAALFNIDSSTGVLTFKTAPNFEATPTKTNYTVKVNAAAWVSSGGALVSQTASQTLTIKLEDVINEDTPVLAFGNQVNASGGISRAEALGYRDAAGHVFGVITATGVPDGQTLVVTFDRGNGKTVQVNVAGYGNGGEKLQVPLTADQLVTLGDGPISVKATSKDANGHVSADSNVLNFTLDTVAPAFASASTTFSVAENSTLVGTLATSTTESVSWSIALDNDANNANASLFTINSSSGALSFTSAPNFESPKDATQSNVYRVRVVATDAAGNTATQAVTVNVTDASESLQFSAIPGNPYVQAGVASPLPDLQLQSVPSAGVSVVLVATGGALDFPADLKFKVGAVISDNASRIEMRGNQADINAALAALTFTSDLTANGLSIAYSAWPGVGTITNAPLATSTLSLQTQTLNAPVITPVQRQYRSSNLLVSNQALSQQLIDNYNLSDSAVFAALAGQYNSDSTKTMGGDLGWSLASNYVDPYSRTMVSLKPGQVSATPVQSQFGWHLIQLTGIRDLPGTIGDSGAGINLRAPENTPASQALISYGANESVTWTLTGTDAALFAIDNSGALTFKSSPDFEVPQDAGAHNTYHLNVVATITGTNQSTIRPITVTVTNAASGGALTTTGAATEGQVLTASLSLPSLANGGDPFADANPAITWHWQTKGADGLWADIYGANNSNYTLPVDGSMLGAQVRVAAIVTDSTGVTLNFASAGQTVADNGLPPPAITYPFAQLLWATGAQNGLLNSGDVITASVNFNQPIKVSGRPQLVLYIGGGSAKANYDSTQSVEASGLLRFTYTLASSDASDANGIAIGSLDLNGATLSDANKTTLTPMVSAPDNPLFKIDNTPPAEATLSFVGSIADTNANYADVANGFIKISGAESGATVNVTLYRASGASLVKTFTGNFSDQPIALSPADIAALGNGLITATAVVTDSAGNATAAVGQLTFTLDTLAPTLLSPAWFHFPVI